VIDDSLTWVKSSYSGSQGGNCVEAAADGVGRVLVRDTKDRGGAVVEFRASQWREFSASLKAAATGKLSNCIRSRKAGITPEDPAIRKKSPQPERTGPAEISFSCYSSPTGGAGSDRTRRRRGPVA
jgi:hypothetical protein